MDIVKLNNLFSELIREFEKAEMYSIMVYSNDMNRDINLMHTKSQLFRKRLEKILADGQR